MTTTRPEVGFERLLAALGQDLLGASDEEILAIAQELGQKPEMKGSSALLGVTFEFRLSDPREPSEQDVKDDNGTDSIRRARRRPKRDAPDSG